MVGSDYTPDVSDFYSGLDDASGSENLSDSTPAGDPNEPGLQPQPQQSWLQKLARTIAGPQKQTGGQQSQQSQDTQQANQLAQGRAASSTPNVTVPKPQTGTAWGSDAPAAEGKVAKGQRTVQSTQQMAHAVGELIKMAAGAYMGGGMGGSVPAETGTGAATSIPAGTTQTYMPGGGGSPVMGSSGGGLSSMFGGGGGGGGGGLSNLAQSYFGGGGMGGGDGGFDYSSIMKLAQGGGGGGGGMGGGGGGGMGGGVQEENQAITNMISDLTGESQKQTEATAMLPHGMQTTGQGLATTVPWYA